jgi:hypothetical protein
MQREWLQSVKFLDSPGWQKLSHREGSGRMVGTPDTHMKKFECKYLSRLGLTFHRNMTILELNNWITWKVLEMTLMLILLTGCSALQRPSPSNPVSVRQQTFTMVADSTVRSSRHVKPPLCWAEAEPREHIRSFHFLFFVSEYVHGAGRCNKKLVCCGLGSLAGETVDQHLQ